ncbi:LysE family translocator [Nesterenkonia alba]|uniref:LysE family translocator n=1 Tax=Nesterenkonia alba TaxID=515814 RepID=UPI0003B34FF5|nr:LysE family translocator [Nesterenkonia alba]
MSIEWHVFLGLVLLSYISPGPDTVMVLRASARGNRIGFLAAAGALTGLTVHMMVSAVGLSALLVALPGSLTVLTLLGALYLAYLGVRAILASGQMRRDAKEGLAGAAPLDGEKLGRAAFQRTLITNLANPKVILFFVAVLPQFIDASSTWPVALQLGVLGALDVLVGVFYLPLFVLFGARIFRGIGGRGLANLELCVGLLLLIFAGVLVYDTFVG